MALGDVVVQRVLVVVLIVGSDVRCSVVFIGVMAVGRGGVVVVGGRRSNCVGA